MKPDMVDCDVLGMSLPTWEWEALHRFQKAELRHWKGKRIHRDNVDAAAVISFQLWSHHYAHYDREMKTAMKRLRHRLRSKEIIARYDDLGGEYRVFPCDDKGDMVPGSEGEVWFRYPVWRLEEVKKREEQIS